MSLQLDSMDLKISNDKPAIKNCILKHANMTPNVS